MPSATLARLVARCRGLSALAPSPDADLLRRFARARDPDAFAELLARHAGLVWGVCRRTLPQEADAEDAFQAVFLALARGARSIDPHRPLAGWLHAVAVRVARRALGKALRRRTSDLPECAGPADVVGEVSSRDLFRAVDEEIDRLPAALRAPMVLCCLEGQARDEVADLLGCSVPAVKARLERGRQALRAALARRGIAPPAAFAVLGLGAGRVGAGLRERAVQSALGSASPAVVQLAAAGASHHVGVLGRALAAAVVAVGVGLVGLPFGQPNTPPGDSRSESPTLPARGASGLVDRFGDPLPDGAARRFGTLRFRNDVGDLAFTPDGKRLVAGVGGYGSPLAVFDPADGRKLAQVGGSSNYAYYGFALSPDGKHAYITTYQITKWDMATGARVGDFFQESIFCGSVVVSPDSKKVAVARETPGGSASAMIFDADTGEKRVDVHLKDLRAPGVDRLAFSPDGKTVAAVVSEVKQPTPYVQIGTPIGVRLWEVATGKTLATIAPPGEVPYTFAFVPGTNLLACPGKGGVIHLWDTGAGKFTRTVPLPKGDEPAAEWAAKLQVSADGRRAAVYLRGGTVLVFDPKTGTELRRLTPGKSTVGAVALALSPDGALVAYGRYGDSCVRVWEVDTGKERLADAGHRGPAELSLPADGRTLLSRGAGQVFHWDLATGEGTPRPDDVKDPDGVIPDVPFPKLAYRAGRYRIEREFGSGEIEVRTRDGSKSIARTRCPKDGGFTVARSADGRTVAVSFLDPDATVLLWSPEARAEPLRLTGHPDACLRMAFTHDGKHLIAGAGQHDAYPTETVFVYEAATGRLVRKLATNRTPTHLLITADDRTLITGIIGGPRNAETVKVWDLATGKELATLADPGVAAPGVAEPRGGGAAVSGLALSADERFLAAVTGHAGASSVSVWDTGSWKLVKAFPPSRPRAEAASVVVARDGRSVFVAYHDSTILEWDVAGRFGKPAAPHPAAPARERLDDLWRDLGDPTGKGYAAAWELLDHPAAAVAVLKTRLAPVPPTEAALVKGLVGKLGSDSFREREEAGRRLVALGEVVLPAVREAAAGKVSAEAKERAGRVIAALTAGPTPDQLRHRRAVAVLEWSGRPEAVEHLRALAGGDPNARLTVESRAALRRAEKGN